MSQILASKLITRQMAWHSTFTDKNHLGKALLTKPAVFAPVFDQLFSAQTTKYMFETGRVKEIGTDSWEYTLRGAHTRPCVIVENVEQAGNVRVGADNNQFKIKLDENWFTPGDYIHPGTSNKKYQLRVMDYPTKHGLGWIYRVQLGTNDSSAFLPNQFLQPGQQWGKLYSKYGEAEDQSGSTQYSTPMGFRNRMSRYRKHYQITGDAHDEVLAVGIVDNNGQKHMSWMRYAEAMYWMQWYQELEAGKWYSRSSDIIQSASGYPVNSGPGIQEMLEDSHIHKYSVLTAKLIEEYMMDIFYSRNSPGGSERNVVAYTGEYGMIQFHRAIQDWATKNGFIKQVNVQSDLVASKTGSKYHKRAISAGHQFVEYYMANGSTLRLEHLPIYDDRNINFEIDPITSFPVESQRITFLDFAGRGKNSNITTVKKKNSFKHAYIAGLQTPYGPRNGGDAAHSGNYYEMHVEQMCGTHIEDISACGELILARN